MRSCIVLWYSGQRNVGVGALQARETHSRQAHETVPVWIVREGMFIAVATQVLRK